MKAKISAKYWYSLKRFEQDWIEERISNAKDNVSGCKHTISQARKQHPEYSAIYGNGRIVSKGIEYMYSGSDTKRFIELKP